MDVFLSSRFEPLEVFRKPENEPKPMKVMKVMQSRGFLMESTETMQFWKVFQMLNSSKTQRFNPEIVR